MSKYLNLANNKNYVLEWNSKGTSDESIKPPATINTILNSLLEYGNKLKLKFNKRYLKQGIITYSHGKIVNIYIVHEINKNHKIVYLVQLVRLKMLILVSLSTLDMELDLIDMNFTHTLVVELVKM